MINGSNSGGPEGVERDDEAGMAVLDVIAGRPALATT
jgi:hypothetical protein